MTKASEPVSTTSASVLPSEILSTAIRPLKEVAVTTPVILRPPAEYAVLSPIPGLHQESS